MRRFNPEEIQAKRLNDLMTKIMMWLKAAGPEERALVEFAGGGVIRWNWQLWR